MLDASGLDDTVIENGRRDAATKLNTFTCFPNLPEELRLLVWKLALPAPRILGLRFWEEDEIHIEYTSRDGNLSTVLLDVCNESSRVFLQHYTHSAVVLLSTPYSEAYIDDIFPRTIVQHGLIDLENDLLYFDLKTLRDTLAGYKSSMVMRGLKKAAIRSLDWSSMITLYDDFSEKAFPNLRHLAVIVYETLDESELRCQHLISDCKRLSLSFSVIHGGLATDPTTIPGTDDFKLVCAAQKAFSEVVIHEGGTRTRMIAKVRLNRVWSIFFAQQHILLMQAANQMLEATVKSLKNATEIRQETSQMLEKNAQRQLELLQTQVAVLQTEQRVMKRLGADILQIRFSRTTFMVALVLIVAEFLLKVSKQPCSFKCKVTAWKAH